jgi:hypothetical protein
MSGEVSIDRRLSPSGRFIKDAASGVLLPIGSGTPGLVWRGQLTSAPLDIGGSTPIVLPGQGGAWDLPANYYYDVEVWLAIKGKAVGGPGGHTTGDLVVLVEGSTDYGSTWSVLMMGKTLPSTVLYSEETRNYAIGTIGVSSLLSADLTNVRTRACRLGSAADTFAVNDSWTKISQYVL